MPQHPEKSIDELVQEVRSLYRSKIQFDCGQIRFLNRQVPIDDLYTKVYILEDIPKLRSLDISERMQGFDPTADDPNSFYLGKVGGEPIPGLDVVTDACKLMCLGAPGSGKTTYLSYVAIQCNKKKLQANRVPIFIRLFSFAEKVAEKLTEQPQWSLFDYIEDLLRIQGIQQVDVKSILLEGRGLILLDGLDEVPKNIEKLNIFSDLPKKFDLSKLILRRIREFCETYHKNSRIITCRTNALNYNFSNLGFTQFIVADFEDKQIEVFAEKWFVAAAKNHQEVGKTKAQQFINKLRLSRNKRIRDLAVTPLLLELTCLVFKNNDDFPSNRAEIYKQASDIMLKEWDRFRDIPRNEVSVNLDLEGKKALLTHVAKVTLEETRYFFKQEEIEKYIADYLKTLPNAQTYRLPQDSEAVLKSIEVQHGLLIERADEIYSFSHLTFQEYFAAKWFCDRADLHGLAKYLTKTRRQEVFLRAVEMAKSTDPAKELLILIKKETDASITSDPDLKAFFTWVKQQSASLQGSFLPALRRISYLLLSDAFVPNSIFMDALKGEPSLNDESKSTLENAIGDFIQLETNFTFVLTSAHSFRMIGGSYSFAIGFSFMLIFNLDMELQEILKDLVKGFSDDNKRIYEWWWASGGEAWIEKLRAIMLDYRNADQQWQFSPQQKELLQQYYDTNLFLVNCLNSGCAVSSEVRKKIEETLFLP